MCQVINFLMMVLLICGSLVACAIKTEEKDNVARIETAERVNENSMSELELVDDMSHEWEKKESVENIENKDGNVMSNDSEKKTTVKYMEGDEWLKIIGDVEETKDRRIVYELAKEFTMAYFEDDLETIKKYLVEDYIWPMDSYLTYVNGKPYGAENVTIYGIKGLCDVKEEMNESCTVEVEFLPVESDSLLYFFMVFEKQNCEWKISCYGLER